MGDIGKWSAMDENRIVFQCLYKIRLESFLHDNCSSTVCLDVFDGDWFVIIGVCDNASGNALLEVVEVFGKTQDGHDFTCHSDDKAVFAFHTVCLLILGNRNGTQRAVVHIHASFPDNLSWINI